MQKISLKRIFLKNPPEDPVKKKYITKSSSNSDSKATRTTKINKTKILGISELVSGPRLNLIFQEKIFSLQ